ncbi:MAG: hypothetical protein RI885_2045 [Actinomycetota bacterium]|jgi:putative ABC transport system permease protein
MRFLSGVVGAVSEAWAELRIHRTRVLLSLIGVAVAVAALTAVVGLGAIAQQATAEQIERSSGRPATLLVNAFRPAGEPLDSADVDEAFSTATERYSIDWSSRNAYTQIPVQLVDGVRQIDTNLVDADFGEMHRVEVESGRWFDDADVTRLAPAVIVSAPLWESLGSPDVRTHPTLQLSGDGAPVAVVVGVTPRQFEGETFSMTMLYASYSAFATPDQRAQVFPSFEVWVPADIADELTERLRRDIAGALGETVQVDVVRNDFQFGEGEDPLLPVKLLVGGVAVLILLLGALSLVNISLVTIRQRIREIGIRRSFGATAGRVFFAVMMESVVGTVAAGVVGVFIAVLVVENPTLQQLVAQGATDLPPFPIEAALLGIGAATAVGALSGLLPALVAVRVKVIDAIRY